MATSRKLSEPATAKPLPPVVTAGAAKPPTKSTESVAFFGAEQDLPAPVNFCKLPPAAAAVVVAAGGAEVVVAAGGAAASAPSAVTVNCAHDQSWFM